MWGIGGSVHSAPDGHVLLSNPKCLMVRRQGWNHEADLGRGRGHPAALGHRRPEISPPLFCSRGDLSAGHPLLQSHLWITPEGASPGRGGCHTGRWLSGGLRAPPGSLCGLPPTPKLTSVCLWAGGHPRALCMGPCSPSPAPLSSDGDMGPAC